MKEIWKPVANKPYNKSHLVSNLGRIKTIKGKLLKPTVNSNGYHRVGLYKSGTIKWFQLSRLILFAFAGNPPKNKTQAMHLNDNKNNNKLINLKWGSAQDNQDLKVLHSRQAKGEKNGRSKLKREQILSIRKLYAEGSYNQSELARTFNISHGQAWAIVRNKNWIE